MSGACPSAPSAPRRHVTTDPLLRRTMRSSLLPSSLVMVRTCTRPIRRVAQEANVGSSGTGGPIKGPFGVRAPVQTAQGRGGRTATDTATRGGPGRSGAVRRRSANAVTCGNVLWRTHADARPIIGRQGVRGSSPLTSTKGFIVEHRSISRFGVRS